MNKIKTLSIITVITLIFEYIIYYLFLPALNIKSEGFWFFIIGIIAFVSLLLYAFSMIAKSTSVKTAHGSFALLSVILLIFIITKLASTVFFRAKTYSKLISTYITEHDFEDYSATIGNVPLLDKVYLLGLLV